MAKRDCENAKCGLSFDLEEDDYIVIERYSDGDIADQPEHVFCDLECLLMWAEDQPSVGGA